jgi:hypothetical protein
MATADLPMECREYVWRVIPKPTWFLTTDALGRLPLHLAMTHPHHVAINLWRALSKQLSHEILKAQLATTDCNGRLPLHVALGGGSPFFDEHVRPRRRGTQQDSHSASQDVCGMGVIGSMIEVVPDTVTRIDGATGFYLFMLASVGRSGNKPRSSGGSFRQLLTTIYELLRRTPEVIQPLTFPTKGA